MARFDKELARKELEELFKKYKSFFVVCYGNISVNDINDFRRGLNGSSVYVVVKNSLCKRVMTDNKLEGGVRLIEGPTAVAFCRDEGESLAKSLYQFSKNHPGMQIRGGYVSGEFLAGEEVMDIAKLPPRIVLLGQVATAVAAPVSRMVFALSSLRVKLVRVIDEVSKRK